MRNRFEEQLTELNRNLIEMGALCEEAIALSAKVLTEGNLNLLKKVISVDSEIDHKEREIETLC